MKLALIIRLSLSFQLVISQNIDWAKFARDAGELLLTAFKSFSNFKPEDWMKLARAVMDQDDQKVTIQILEGLLQGGYVPINRKFGNRLPFLKTFLLKSEGGDAKEALFKFASTKTGELLFEKLEGLVLESLELKEKYFGSLNDFKEKAAQRKAKKKKRNFAKKGIQKKRKPQLGQEQNKQRKKPPQTN